MGPNDQTTVLAQSPCQRCAKPLFDAMGVCGSNVSALRCEVTEPPTGGAIYRQGQLGHQLFGVCKGVIRLEQAQASGRSKVVRMLPAGSLFGLELLSESAYLHTALSVGKSRVVAIEAPTLALRASQDASVQAQVLQEWASVLKEADFVISHLLSGTARQRVARLLLHLLPPGLLHGDCQAPPRDQMASLLDLTPETVSRTTASFKREGLISESGGVFTVDQAALQRTSEPDH
jgi:CRP/FNR family transcriptional regulator, anaerobic regulatory protein